MMSIDKFLRKATGAPGWYEEGKGLSQRAKKPPIFTDEELAELGQADKRIASPNYPQIPEASDAASQYASDVQQASQRRNQRRVKPYLRLALVEKVMDRPEDKPRWSKMTRLGLGRLNEGEKTHPEGYQQAGKTWETLDDKVGEQPHTVAEGYPRKVRNAIEKTLLKLMKQGGEENGEGTGYQFRHGAKPTEGPPPYHPIHPDTLWLRRIRQQPSNTPEEERGDFPKNTSYQQQFGRHREMGEDDLVNLDDEAPYVGEASGGSTAQHAGTAAMDSRSAKEQLEQEPQSPKDQAYREMMRRVFEAQGVDLPEDHPMLSPDSYPPEVWRTKEMGRTDLDPSMQEAVRGRKGPGSGLQNSIEKTLLKLMKEDGWSGYRPGRGPKPRGSESSDEFNRRLEGKPRFRASIRPPGTGPDSEESITYHPIADPKTGRVANPLRDASDHPKFTEEDFKAEDWSRFNPHTGEPLSSPKSDKPSKQLRLFAIEKALLKLIKDGDTQRFNAMAEDKLKKKDDEECILVADGDSKISPTKDSLSGKALEKDFSPMDFGRGVVRGYRKPRPAQQGTPSPDEMRGHRAGNVLRRIGDEVQDRVSWQDAQVGKYRIPTGVLNVNLMPRDHPESGLSPRKEASMYKSLLKIMKADEEWEVPKAPPPRPHPGMGYKERKDAYADWIEHAAKTTGHYPDSKKPMSQSDREWFSGGHHRGSYSDNPMTGRQREDTQFYHNVHLKSVAQQDGKAMPSTWLSIYNDGLRLAHDKMPFPEEERAYLDEPYNDIHGRWPNKADRHAIIKRTTGKNNTVDLDTFVEQHLPEHINPMTPPGGHETLQDFTHGLKQQVNVQQGLQPPAQKPEGDPDWEIPNSIQNSLLKLMKEGSSSIEPAKVGMTHQNARRQNMEKAPTAAAPAQPKIIRSPNPLPENESSKLEERVTDAGTHQLLNPESVAAQTALDVATRVGQRMFPWGERKEPSISSQIAQGLMTADEARRERDKKEQEDNAFSDTTSEMPFPDTPTPPSQMDTNKLDADPESTAELGDYTSYNDYNDERKYGTDKMIAKSFAKVFGIHLK